jgi:hypothetical protein
VCRFCSNNANPEAYNDISSSCRTETPTQKRAQCIGDSYTSHKRMYICKSKFKKDIPYFTLRVSQTNCNDSVSYFKFDKTFVKSMMKYGTEACTEGNKDRSKIE